MKKIIVSVCAIWILFGEAIAMKDVPQDQSSTGQIAKVTTHFNVATLKNFTLSAMTASNMTSLYIEKYAYSFLTAIAKVFEYSMMYNTTLLLLFNANLKHSEEFVEVPVGEGAYLAALARIFSGERLEVSDESLNDILFAAERGCQDAGITIKLACIDLSYEEAIAKGEYRAKECLKNRILGTPYTLDFYRPLAVDFPIMLASSSSDWPTLFKHIFANISYLKSEGNIGYAYAAVQDVCCLYETLKEQYKAHSGDAEFRGNIATFLLVASRVFADLHNDDLRSQFEELSNSVQLKDPNCINNALVLFAAAVKALEQHDD